MKSIVSGILVGTLGAAAAAQDYGRVLSSTPVVGQVSVPQQFCQQDSIAVPGQRSGAGAAIGAIAGATLGSAIGHGGGRAASTIIGMIGGAVIGDQIEGRGDSHIQQVQRCTTHTAYENRVLYYDVVYEFGGRQYAAQLPNDPGANVRLHITPVDAVPAPVPVAPPLAQAPAVTTIHSTVEYVPYSAPVRIAPIVIGLPWYGYVAPQPHRHWHRSAGPHPRHRGHGAAPHWR